MITFIVALFVIGYLCIALESVLKINKAAPALLMCVGCWVLYMLDAGSFIQSFRGVNVAAADVSQWVNEHILLSHLGDTCEILFFLMGAMTIVKLWTPTAVSTLFATVCKPNTSTRCYGA